MKAHQIPKRRSINPTFRTHQPHVTSFREYIARANEWARSRFSPINFAQQQLEEAAQDYKDLQGIHINPQPGNLSVKLYQRKKAKELIELFSWLKQQGKISEDSPVKRTGQIVNLVRQINGEQ